MTNSISKSKLKAHMLEVFRELEASGEELVITDRDRPVLRIVPIKDKGTVGELFSGLEGRVLYHEDINAPTLSEWKDA
jgi:antitoxin (DNA-binding transcriptional repressor) of toxin-antitoxin stability system